MRKFQDFLVLSLIVSFHCYGADPDTLIHQGTSWKYFDLGASPASNWTDMTYNDSVWASGFAELGYGDGDENTVVSYGPNSANKYITTYFRSDRKSVV